ncbi:protein-disulfide reductase DsbD domain-containing protein, partial [Zunongwangia pacifica]
MRVFFLMVSLLIGLQSLNAQIYDPVSFETAVEQKNAGEYELQIKVKLEAGWHLYAQQVPEGGPIPTSFEFEPSVKYELKGEVIEPKGHEVDDPVFEMRIKYFENEVLFTQRILRKSSEAFDITAVMNYMVCNDESCLPPEGKTLQFNLKKEPKQPVKAESQIQQPVSEPLEQSSPEPKENVSDNYNDTFSSEDTISNQQSAVKASAQKDSLSRLPTSTVPQSKSANDLSQEKEPESSRDLFTIFILSFLGGFAALLTPCVFP